MDVSADIKAVPLSERVMIVRLQTHRWHARKSDSKIAKEVATRSNTEASRHSHTRRLLAKESLEKITKAFSAASEYHHTHTSPWEDGGMRIISSLKYTEYLQNVAKLQRDVRDAANEFANVYPDLLAEEEKNPLFDVKDYPPVGEIRGRFSIRVIADYLPKREDFRVVGISDDENARIQAEIEARTNEKLKGVVTDVWKRVYDHVAHISERMKAYDEREERLADAKAKANRRQGPNKGKLPEDLDTRTGLFTDSLIKNLRELVEIIPDLDLTGDPELANIRTKLLNQLCPHDPEDLRQSPLLRKRVTENADKILATVSDFLA